MKNHRDHLNGFQLRKLKKKESILQAAQELFSTYGVKNTSMAKIAIQASVSPVTLYNYFGSKNNLVKAVISQFMEIKWKESEDIFEAPLPFPQKITKIILEKDKVEERDAWFVHSLSLNDPEIREQMETYYQNKSIPLLLKLIEQGKEEGFVDPGISNEAVLFYLEVFKKAVYQPAFLADENKATRQGLTRLFFYGLMGRPTTSDYRSTSE